MIWFLKEFKKVYHFDTLLSLGLSYIMKQNIYDVVNYSKNEMESKILNEIPRNILFFFHIYVYIYITDISIIDYETIFEKSGKMILVIRFTILTIVIFFYTFS